MLRRRDFLASMAAMAAPAHADRVSPKERVNLVLAGKAPDRAPFTFWHHFKDSSQPALKHAASTLDFQRRFHTDIVKVMSDYPYPKGTGESWYQLKEVKSPFPEQLKALELIAEGLSGQKYFVETIFNPWNVAGKLSSKEAVQQLMKENPQALLDALEAIAKSEANHAKAALETGASGIFLAIDNAQDGILTREQYKKFSEPFDRMVLAGAANAPMNTLHLHGDKVYLDIFWKGWPANIINYAVEGTGVNFAAARKHFQGVLMGGLHFNTLPTSTNAEIKAMIDSAHVAAPKWICAPGCSVPDDSPESELARISKLLRGA